jgi:hypothetical protein
MTTTSARPAVACPRDKFDESRRKPWNKRESTAVTNGRQQVRFAVAGLYRLQMFRGRRVV